MFLSKYLKFGKLFKEFGDHFTWIEFSGMLAKLLFLFNLLFRPTVSGAERGLSKISRDLDLMPLLNIKDRLLLLDPPETRLHLSFSILFSLLAATFAQGLLGFWFIIISREKDNSGFSFVHRDISSSGNNDKFWKLISWISRIVYYHISSMQWWILT